MTRYKITLVNVKTHTEKTLFVDADTALDAMKKARMQNHDYQDVTACVPVKFLG
jgi:hypothetical protein